MAIKAFQGNTLTKSERLCSQKKIQELFKKGSSFYIYPFRFQFIIQESKEQVNIPEMLVSVPKRTFKRANARNFLKRRTKEAYRLNKQILLQSPEFGEKKVIIAFIYTAKEKLSFHFIEKKLILGLERLVSSQK